MSATDWSAVATGVITVTTSVVIAIKWLVKHYLHELVPNSGSSIKDRVVKIENRLDRIYEILLERA